MKKIFYLLFFVTICLLCVDCERGDEDFNLKISGEHEKHGYVDLGLSVKWATCNIGAINPEEYGDYFAWGEVEPKEVYDWSTYRYALDWNQVIKYCDNDFCGKDGFVDDKIELDSEDDAATMNWGGDWRMPTNVEMDELKTQCSWTWITLNEIDGYLVTSVRPGCSCWESGSNYVLMPYSMVRTCVWRILSKERHNPESKPNNI